MAIVEQIAHRRRIQLNHVVIQWDLLVQAVHVLLVVVYRDEAGIYFDGLIDGQIAGKQAVNCVQNLQSLPITAGEL